MKARIFQRPKSSTQSGKSRAGQWVVAFERSTAQRHDPLMGWIGSGDTDTQVEMNFASEDAAVAYAHVQGLDYEIVRLPLVKLKLQAYADNFR